MSKQEAVSSGKRKKLTLVEQQSMVGVRDPAAHAKRQVSELDKTAQRSLGRRKGCTDQLEQDQKELDHINDQIERIKLRYDPLCAQLEERVQLKKELIEKLEACIKEEKRIMKETISTVNERKMDDSKLMNRMGSLQLESLRGYNMGPNSTFRQSEQQRSPIGKLGTMNNSANIASAQTLPPIGTGVTQGITRNLSSSL